MDFIPVMSSGRPIIGLPDVPVPLAEAMAATAVMYGVSGFKPPWVSYVAAQDGVCVGICSFKSAPVDDAVEITCFTLPEHEGNGYGTRMLNFLLKIAASGKPAPAVTALTLPEENASTHILRKLGFEHLGSIEHSADGLVWQWRRPHS